MRVTCPHCTKDVTLPNEKAEQAASCPSCGHIFTAPALLNAMPDEPVPPPSPPVRQYTPPAAAAPSSVVRPTSAATMPKPAFSELEPCCRLTISKTVVHWVGPCALILLFVLSFFTWLAAAPGGYSVYTQSAWGVFGGVFSTDITGEKVLGREADLHGIAKIGWLMVLAMLLLAPGALIGIGALVEKYTQFAVPDIINQLWPKRIQVLAIASLLIFVLLSLQLILGMGLESCATTLAETRFPAPAETETTEQKSVREVKRGEEMSRLAVRRTGWFWLAYLASATAAVGFALELALEQRGDRPNPAIEFKW